MNYQDYKKKPFMCDICKYKKKCKFKYKVKLTHAITRALKATNLFYNCYGYHIDRRFDIEEF